MQPIVLVLLSQFWIVATASNIGHHSPGKTHTGKSEGKSHPLLGWDEPAPPQLLSMRPFKVSPLSHPPTALIYRNLNPTVEERMDEYQDAQ